MHKNVCSEKCKVCNLEQFLAPSWRSLLIDEFKTDYFNRIKSTLHSSDIVFPPTEQIFSFSQYFGIKDTRVVILGQDPYHGMGQANGLAFSVNTGIKLPPSLKNILKEVHDSYVTKNLCLLNKENENHNKTKKTNNHEVNFKNGNLECWARQGVLLLNDCLTVKENKPNSHKKLEWNKFTDKIIEIVNQRCQNIVFMLWGKFAQAKERAIDTKKHLVLKAPHPSPLSCYRGFFGCKHFVLANEYLKEHGCNIINWDHLD